MPKVEFQSAKHFFDAINEEPDHPIWSGELYFELHRGTYTTHAAVKKGNRKNEVALKTAEFLATLAFLLTGHSYQTAEFDRLWKLLLLNQFHDVIPGTSIGPVYNDTHQQHSEIAKSGLHFSSITHFLADAITRDAIQRICVGQPATGSESRLNFVNPLSWSRSEVVEIPASQKLCTFLCH